MADGEPRRASPAANDTAGSRPGETGSAGTAAAAKNYVDNGPVRRFWSGTSPEWDVVAEAAGGSALLLGEVKWSEHDPSPAEVQHAVRTLLAKGIPPVRRPQGAEVHHVVFVPKVPRKMPKLPGVHVVGASDILAVLR